MTQTLDRALHPEAIRAGLLQPGEVFETLMRCRSVRFRAEELARFLARPLDQVLHVLSYMTSLGLLDARRDNGVWTYQLARLAEPA
ncbi:MAG: hypothetical protein VKP62_03500 [Candidatus Sericytochromatia bacterium]|nr:hypothetical protein [Candidatus Sericytochromatia bacterium]